MERHTRNARCYAKITESFLASAIRALLAPLRLAIASAQSLRKDGRLTRQRITTRLRREGFGSVHRRIARCSRLLSISPD